MIEWTEPAPCLVGRKKVDGVEVLGYAGGVERFKIQSGDRHAILTDREHESLFIASKGCVEDGFETHMDALKDVAEQVLLEEEG